ncbi:MAG: MFS transporter, partial [Candidatus Hydrothermae bacterium]|nr:MFS transporter [Candidatus Hydrothermae bacterium]
VAMVLFGVGEALRSGTHKALILSYLKEKGWEDRKVAYYGATRSWSQRGSAINALLAGILVISTREYRWVFAASMVPYVLNLINLATYPAWLDARVQRTTTRETLRAFRSMFSPFFLRALVNSALFMGMFRGTKDYLQPVLKDLALALPILLWWHGAQRTALVVAVVYFLLYLLNAYASRNAHRLSAWVSGELHQAINVSYLLGAATVVLAGLAYRWGRYEVVVLFFVGMYVIQNLRRPITMGYLSDVIPENRLATGLSVESNVRTLFAALLAPLMGWLADRYGVGGALVGVGVLTASVYPLITLRPLPRKTTPQNA